MSSETLAEMRPVNAEKSKPLISSGTLGLYVLAVGIILGGFFQVHHIKNEIHQNSDGIHHEMHHMKVQLENLVYEKMMRSHVSVKTRYYPEDFMNYFGLIYLNKTIIDPQIEKDVLNYDINRDYNVSQDAFHFQDRIAYSYEHYLNGFSWSDRRYYIKYISSDKGFGVFASVWIQKGSPVGEYTGVITNNTMDSDYAWTYHSELYDNDQTEQNLNTKISLDALKQGNQMRFVNHDDSPNCVAEYVIYNKIWHVVYVAVETIRPGQELTVSYGSGYCMNLLKLLNHD